MANGNQSSSPPSSGSDIRIAGIGTYLPARRISNTEKLAAFGFTTALLETKLGILKCAQKEPLETTSDLGLRAFEDLAAQMNITASDIDLCCVVTQNPDYNIPHTAAILHHRLDLPKTCMTFDLSQGCAGYVHAIALVTSLMERIGFNNALLFTSDPYSKIVDPDDKDTSLIFGDGATVSYLSRNAPGYAFVDANFGTKPGTSECLMSNGVSQGTENAPPRPVLKMDGTAVLYHAVHEVPGSILALLEKQGHTTEDVDMFLLHQASKRVVDLIRTSLKVPKSKVPFDVADYGNASSSSIPLLMKQHVIEKKLNRLVLSGFGVGFSWGSCLIELHG